MTICAEPGCPTPATHRGRCPRHGRNPNATRNPNRDMAAHMRLARAIRAKHKVCQRCGSTDGLTVHHRDGNATNNNIANGILLCDSCHKEVDPFAR